MIILGLYGYLSRFPNNKTERINLYSRNKKQKKDQLKRLLSDGFASIQLFPVPSTLVFPVV